MTIMQTIILSIIEGVTEFLPISSTGHMIIASSWMGIQEDVFVKNFEVIIQFSAILSVVVLYWKKFLPIQWTFYKKLFIGFLPTGMIGFLLKNYVDQLLSSVTVVAWALIVGGVALYLSDIFFSHLTKEGKKVDDLSSLDYAKLGVFQCFALIPGVSRSGATILGGLILGMNKKHAAEFSFFLAVPTMAAASGYKFLKAYKTLDWSHSHLLILGSVISFFVALLAVKYFITLIGRHGFKPFAYYRILLGVTLLIFN